MKYCFLILLFGIPILAFGQINSDLPSIIEVRENNIPLRDGPSHEAKLLVRVPINEKMVLLAVDPNEYFKVRNERFDGYIFYIFEESGEKILYQSKGPKKPFDGLTEIRRNDSIADIVNRRAKEESKPYFDSLKVKVQQDIQKWKVVFVKKHGQVSGDKIAKCLIWIGMTD